MDRRAQPGELLERYQDTVRRHAMTPTPSMLRCCRRKLAARLGTGAQLNSLVIYASPFTRTVETARYAAEAMELPPDSVQEVTELRERFFGQHDLTSDAAYQTVWAKDTQDAAAHVPGAPRLHGCRLRSG